MRYQIIIGIACVMLATIGIASADIFTFEDTSGGTCATGQITFDENGIVNGACIAGVTNGEMDVQQGTSQDGGNVLVEQSGDIQGDAGFAGTLASDGNGNQGGNFASFSGGAMYIGQATVAGDTTYEFRGYGDKLNIPSDGQVSAVYPSGITLGGVATGQVVEIEGISGTATTAARSGNGGYAQSSATFTEGGMSVMQGSAAGAASLSLPYAYDAFSTFGEIQVPAPVIDDLSLGGVITGQMVEMGGTSGSASTFVTNGRGASGQSTISFTNGGFDEVIQAGAAGQASLTAPEYLTATDGPLSVNPQVGLSIDGVVAGQYVDDLEGDAGSASTSVSSGHGASSQSTVSFTNGDLDDLIQAGAGGDVSLAYPFYTSEEPVELTIGGVIAGQDVDMDADTGSASTTVTNGNGASARSSASFINGGMSATQAGAAGGASLSLMEVYLSFLPDDYAFDIAVGVDGAIAGQDVGMGGDSGSASTTVTNGNGASGQTSASFVSGGEAIGGLSTIQVAGAGDASLGLALSPDTFSTLTGSPLTEREVLELSAGGIFAGQSGGMGGSLGSAQTSVLNVNGHSAGSAVSFTDASHMGSMDFDQLSAGITEVSLGGLSDTHLSGVLTYQDAYSRDFSSIAAGSYAQTPGNSLAQVNTIAQHSSLHGTELSTSGTEFETAQFAGGITYGNLDIALAGQDVDMDSVSSGSASGFSSDSHRNTASVSASVDSGDLRAGSGSIIPSGILAGAGDLGGVSGALAAYTSVNINGASGGLRSDSSNSIGQNAYVHSEFSSTGSLSSTSLGGAVSGQSSGTHVIGALGQNLASSGSTYLLETGTTGATPQSTTTTGTHTAYSLSWPGGYIGDPPISVIT